MASNLRAEDLIKQLDLGSETGALNLHSLYWPAGGNPSGFQQENDSVCHILLNTFC